MSDIGIQQCVHGDATEAADVGMPGSTQAERTRFTEMLKQGDLVDVYQQLNPNPSATDFTWQGYANPKLPCCGMRVDHLLMSSLLLSDPTSLICADRGDDRYVLDHHPLLLEFSVNTDVAKVGALPCVM